MSDEYFQIGPSAASLSEEVASSILDAIFDGKFTCGQHLIAAEVAEWLNVSRTPVREAFLILHRQRFLAKDTSRGFMVSEWSTKDLLEVAQLRAALETLSIELAAARISPADLEFLEFIVLQMDGALNCRDYARLVKLDLQFHHTLWLISNNSRLLQALEDLQVQVRYFMHITRIGDEYDYSSMHRGLISVLRAGDVEKAKAEIRDHILSSASRAVARLNDGKLAEESGHAPVEGRFPGAIDN